MNAILDRLISMDRKNRLHHGFLFVGGESAAENVKKTVEEFVGYIFSKDVEKEDYELTLKKIANQNHPDILRLQSTDSEIKIEAIRDMQRWLSIPPLESARKIVVIEEADHLNTMCSNALLKILEEPPAYALLLLHTNSISRILPTIRSRLFTIQFPELDKEDTEEKKEWVDELTSMLQKKNYTDKDIFIFTEQFSDQRDELGAFFQLIYRTIREKMHDAPPVQFSKLDKAFDLTLNLEQQLYQNYGNIALGLDRFFMEWRNT